MDSIYLLKSLKKEVQGHLNSQAIAFCNEILADGVIGTEKINKIKDYLDHLEDAGVPHLEITEIANRIDIYLSIQQCLLFSYNLPSNSPLKIPQKYYSPAPPDFESLLVALPNQKIMIKAENFNKKLGYGAREDKAGNLICIKIYYKKSNKEWMLIQDGSFIETYYPRFSIWCPLPCDAYIETTINEYYNNIPIPAFPEECKLSPNREHICVREQQAKEYFGCASFSDYYALVMMCFDKWKNRPIRQNTNKAKTYDDLGVSTIFVQSHLESETFNSFKEVPLRESASYVDSMRARGWKIENRLSPCEHVRREHTRHLKSGKVVHVRSAVINKGNTRPIYKI